MGAVNWVIMPVIDGEAYTFDAIHDCLAQTLPSRVLVINNGSTDANRTRLELLAERIANVSVWHHDPPLPSLAATWNRALEFVWECGGEQALVVNNDVRLHQRTYECLSAMQFGTDALFVSGVGVGADDFDPGHDPAASILGPAGDTTSDDMNLPQMRAFFAAIPRGGPDFSCFLITRECHEKYRFDEGLIPAYSEDIDVDRRMILGGDGNRIFGINLPFLHYGSRTINQSKEHWDRFERQAPIGRAYFARKWGGQPNQETFLTPFGQHEPPCGAPYITTPDLRQHCLVGLRLDDGTRSVLGADGALHRQEADGVSGSAETVLGR